MDTGDNMLQKILNIAGHVFVVLILGIGIGIGVFVLVTTLFGDSPNARAEREPSGQEAVDEGAGAGATTPTPGEASQQPGSGSGATPNRPVVSTVFSGDSILLFGMKWEEAWKHLGDGPAPAPGRFISSDEAGVDASFFSSDDDADIYVIRQIRLRAGSSRVTFNGIKVGDTLKSADASLMNAGADYFIGLRWIVDIEGATYEVKCNTSDDKTISSIQIREIDRSEELEQADDGEPSDEDPHDFEPQYWA